MKVLIAGGSGQLGRELVFSAPKSIQIQSFTGQELDIRDAALVAKRIREFQPDAVINAAAYTAVDRAESDIEAAFAVNAVGAGNLGRAAREAGAYFVQISSDFVFDGAQSSPYLPADHTNPLGVYGASKLAGEREALTACGEQCAIVRTAWLYAGHGSNFVLTMLRLLGERESLRVVTDQVGSPTWARNLAAALWVICREKPEGILHLTDAGVASWYDFAVAIMEEALACGLLEREIPIEPINTVAYPTPAKRPAYSVLDKAETWQRLAVSPVHWRTALRQMLMEYKEKGGA